MNRIRLATMLHGMDNLPAEASERHPNGRHKRRITSKVRIAVDAMVWDAATRPAAAEQAGMLDDGLRKAMLKPHVISYMRQQHEARRGSEPFKAYARQIQLAETSQSDDVKERANRWIAGCDGLAPVTKVAIQAQVHHSFDGIGFAPRTVGQTPDVVVDAADNA